MLDGQPDLIQIAVEDGPSQYEDEPFAVAARSDRRRQYKMNLRG